MTVFDTIDRFWFYITHIREGQLLAVCGIKINDREKYKANFSSMHNMQLKCELGCNTNITQEHILYCNFLTQNKSRDQHINYLHINGYPEQQIKVTQIFREG